MLSARFRAAAAVVAASCLVLVAPMSASAAGVGDLSAAVLYEATSPIGSVLTTLSGEDDDETDVALPFPISFDGKVMNGLCVSTNGYVVPVATVGGGCSPPTYDESLEEAAVSEGQSAIGALLHDIDLGNPLWKSAPVTLDNLSVTAGVLNITTGVPHGFSFGDYVDVHFSPDDPDFDESVYGFITGVPGLAQFTLDATGVSDIAAHPVTGLAAIAFSDAADDTDSDGLADDGFGAVQQVYAGPTTFDGKPAFAVTWYRVMSYEDVNDGRLSQTFQVVIVQDATTDGATVGFDFTVQFNFGTVQDNELEDGYDALNPDDECDDARPNDCRFAVGIAYYHPATLTATAQELFANVPKADLMDGGSQALVDNSLNSSVDGRYTISVAAPALAATGAELPVGGIGVGLALLVLGGAVLVVRRRSARAGANR